MRTIVHVSDLHFGAANRERADALLAEIDRLKPNLVAVSGDLTQRGGVAQYKQAAAWLGQICQPQLIVPGNHDGAYFNPIRRFCFPLRRYRQLICDGLMPVMEDDQLHVVGASSFRALTWDWRGFWKNGRLDDGQIGRLEELFAKARPGACRVLVVHHPLINGRSPRGAQCIRRRKRLLKVLRACGVELVLSGHLHHAAAGLAPGMSNEAPVVCVNAGTAISTRLRDEPNSFNVLTIGAESIGLTVHRWNGEAFAAQPPQSFARVGRSTADEPSLTQTLPVL